MSLPNENFFPFLRENEYPEGIITLEKKLHERSVRATFVTSHHIHLAYEYLAAESPVGTVVILHGYTEFYQKYEEMAWYLVNRGYNVLLYDQRGHGYSEREVSDPALAHIDSFADYVTDLEDLIREFVLPTAPGLPLHLYGHSMGGTVCLLYLQKHPDIITSAVLSSPMVIPCTSGVPLFLVRSVVSRKLRQEGSRHRFVYAGSFDPNPPYERSHDRSYARFRHNLEIRINDIHYQNSSSTNGWMKEAVTCHRRLLNRKANQRIRTRIAVFSGGRDTVVRLRPIRKLIRQLPDAEAFYYPEGRHSLYSMSDEGLIDYYLKLFAFLQPKEV